MSIWSTIDTIIDRHWMPVFFGHFLNGVSECSRPDGWSRGKTLNGVGIDPGLGHDEVIEKIKAILLQDRAIKKARPGMGLAPAHVWFLAGAFVAEGRLRRRMKRVAATFAPSIKHAAE